MGKPLMEIDSISLVKYRMYAVQALCVAFVVGLLKSGTRFMGRYVPFFSSLAKVIGCILCPGLVFQISLMFIVFLAAFMLYHGTLERNAVATALSFVIAQGLALPTAASAGQLLGNVMKRASKNLKQEASPWRKLRDIGPLFAKELEHFFTAPTPASFLMSASPSGATGTAVAASVHGKAAASYAPVPTDSEA